MLSDDQVVKEGFKPLRKMETEPIPLPPKPQMSRGMSLAFNTETGERESSQVLWEESSWEKLGRNRGKSMDRSNVFVGTTPYTSASNTGAIVIVDPFSTGAHLAAEACRRGYLCVRVLSVWDSPVAALVQAGLHVDFSATIQHNDRNANQDDAILETVNSLKELPFNILAVIPGAETGVELADQLSFRLGLRSNGIEGSLARRNKYFMGEKVRSAGVRAVKQARCTKEDEVIAFLNTLIAADPNLSIGNVKSVVKPIQSAGSDDVFLCSNGDDALTAFKRINGTINGLGLMNDGVLVQEFLEGKEYVIDKISVDGVHKLVAIWEYDKRKVNGASFVYFGMRLKRSEPEMMQIMVKYADQVLDALGIMQGPSHMEVMLKTVVTVGPDGNETITYDPCLVEVGARCHGGEGTWLDVAKECIGHNQVTCTLDAYTTREYFRSMDKCIYKMQKAGRDIDLVSRHGGIVRGFPGEPLIKKLASFRTLNWEVKPGEYCPITIDCFSRPGSVQLVAETEEEADRDLEFIHSLEEMHLIDYAVICPKPPTIGAVVIVDPFSTGANMAAMVLAWGYKLILIFSEKDSPVAKLVSAGTNVKPTLLIQHDNTHPNQDFAIAQTLESIDSQGSPILAILPGAETGVELCDKLAYRYKTRNNGELMTPARRNKYLMQERVRSCGVRAVQQKLCRSDADVDQFWADLTESNKGSSALNCVVKPNESAGTDSVYLCTTKEQVADAVKSIHNKINGLGQLNDGALCQEFLQGTEFVVDGVSRDGVYKVTAIWEYDKRSVNGANFVYYGMHLRDPYGAGDEGAICKALVDYARQVVKSLEIFNGPSHMEIMLNTSTGPENLKPCLVEVGARCHGGEGSWLPVVNECIGYSQVDSTLNCYLRPDRFDALPPAPRLQCSGCEAFLVSYFEGPLLDIPGMAKIREMESFRRMEMMTQPGNKLVPTIDCFTRPGSVQMVNKSAAMLKQDYETIRGLEKDGLFKL